MRHYQRSGSNNIGALGANSEASVYIPQAELKVTDVVATYDNYKFSELMKDGKWIVKAFPAQSERDVTLHINLVGTGTSLVYATTLWSDDNREYLFIKRVKAGMTTVKFRVPSNALASFTLGTSKQVNANYGTKLLYKSDVRKLTNKLLVTNQVNLHETDGLGSIPADPLNPTEANNPIPGATTREQSGILQKYWDGNANSHSWETHDFTGHSSPNAAAKNKRPIEVTEWSGTSAMRMSHYVAAYDENGDFKGFDCREFDSQTISAGTPIATVVQYFVKPTGAIRLYKKTRLGNIPIPIPLTPGESMEFKPTWYYADNVEQSPDSFYLVEPSVYQKGNQSIWNNPSLPTFAADQGVPTSLNIALQGPVAGAIPSYWSLKEILTATSPDKKGQGFKGKSLIPGNAIHGVNWKKEHAALVEWFDPSTDTWSKPRPHPPKIPKTNAYGKTVLIYRFPRQLDPQHDRSEINRLSAAGQDYSWEATKYCYPYPHAKIGGKVGGHALIGRLQPTNSVDAWAEKYEITIEGETFAGRREIEFVPMIKAISHKKKGFDIARKNKSKIDSTGLVRETILGLDTELQKLLVDTYYETHHLGAVLRVADSSKWNYLNTPQLNTAYFINKSFKPGSRFIVIGQALGTTFGKEQNTRVYTSDNDWDGYYLPETLQPHGKAERPISDGTAAGTFIGDYLDPLLVITTNDLIDNVIVPGEESIRELWIQIFGVKLSAEFFSTYEIKSPKRSGARSAGAIGQDPNKKTHYLINTPEGQMSFPYSIAVYEIPMYWVGPYADQDEEGNYRQPEGKPFAMKSADDPVKISYSTAFGQYVVQDFTIMKEIEDQIELEGQGVPPIEIFADNNWTDDADNRTQEVADEEKRRGETGGGGGSQKKKSPVMYTNNAVKANSWNYDDDRVSQKELEEAGLMGFTQSADYIVEDVTNQWSSKSNRGNQNDFLNNMDMLDMGMEDGMHGDPMMNLGAIDGAIDTAVDAAVVATVTGVKGIHKAVKVAHEGLGGALDWIPWGDDDDDDDDDDDNSESNEGGGNGGGNGGSNGSTDSDEKSTMRETGKAGADFVSGVAAGLFPNVSAWYTDNAPYSYAATVLGMAALIYPASVFALPGASLSGGARVIEGTGDLLTAPIRVAKKALN